MSDRGMKKWAPYASLIEQKGTMNRMKSNRTKQNKPLLSSEAADAINRALFENMGKVVQILYFDNGERKKIQTTLLALKIEDKQIKTSDGYFLISSLLSVESN
jgi:hypothetical protein